MLVGVLRCQGPCLRGGVYGVGSVGAVSVVWGLCGGRVGAVWALWVLWERLALWALFGCNLNHNKAPIQKMVIKPAWTASPCSYVIPVIPVSTSLKTNCLKNKVSSLLMQTWPVLIKSSH